MTSINCKIQDNSLDLKAPEWWASGMFTAGSVALGCLCLVVVLYNLYSHPECLFNRTDIIYHRTSIIKCRGEEPITNFLH